MTSGFEWTTIQAQFERNISIFACHMWGAYSLKAAALGRGVNTDPLHGDGAVVGHQPGGQLILNTDVFLRAWNKIKANQKARLCQSIVKVDVDAVFFPERLQVHLNWKHNPWHNRVYFKNCRQFNSMQGPLEVYSNTTATAFFDEGQKCNGINHWSFGEDIYMQKCMQWLGAQPLVDYDMVADQYCGTLPGTCKCWGPPSWKPALHPCKSTDTWLNCWKVAKKSKTPK